jgi:hypothetical protein
MKTSLMPSRWMRAGTSLSDAKAQGVSCFGGRALPLGVQVAYHLVAGGLLRSIEQLGQAVRFRAGSDEERATGPGARADQLAGHRGSDQKPAEIETHHPKHDEQKNGDAMFDEELHLEEKADGNKQAHKRDPGSDQQLQVFKAAREGEASVEIVVAKIDDDKQAEQHKHRQVLEGRGINAAPPAEHGIANHVGKIERRGQRQHIQHGQQHFVAQEAVPACIRVVHVARIVAYTLILRPFVCCSWRSRCSASIATCH